MTRRHTFEGVCSDCLYFAEYGKLDDMTMIDVEKSREEHAESLTDEPDRGEEERLTEGAIDAAEQWRNEQS